MGTEPESKLSTKLNRLSELARQNPTLKFTSLVYLLDEEALSEAYRELNPKAAAGIHQVDYKDYGENLRENIADLVKRLKTNRYRATDIRRAWLPKPEGGQCPLGILVLKDKIVQKAVVKILSAIYEQDFLVSSYRFRENRSKRNGTKLSTFDFLGFTHNLTRSRKGGPKLGRKTISKRMGSKLVEMNKELKRLRNALPFGELYKHLCRILKGYYNYFGFAGNFATLRKFEYAIRRLWFKWLNRRNQRKSFKWKEFEALLTRYSLPEPRILKGYRWIYSATL